MSDEDRKRPHYKAAIVGLVSDPEMMPFMAKALLCCAEEDDSQSSRSFRRLHENKLTEYRTPSGLLGIRQR